MQHRALIAAVGLAIGGSSACDCGTTDATSAPVTTQPGTPTAAYGLTPEQAAAPVLRLANGQVVTLRQFAERLGPPPLQRNRPLEPERRRNYLDELVELELLAAEANARGLVDRDPEEVRRAALVQAAMDRLFGPDGELVEPLTDAQVAAAYEARSARYTSPERRRASHIQLANREAAQLMLEQLKNSADLAKDFGELARLQSHDFRTRNVRGDLGFFTRSEPPQPDAGPDATTRATHRTAPHIAEALRDAAFATAEVGALHPQLVEGEGGFFHLVLLTGLHAAQRVPLPQIERQLRMELLEERRAAAAEALLDRLVEDARVHFHDEDMALVRVPE